jgi:hypothetical protein
MKTLALASLLLLSAFTAFSQNPSDAFDKAPAPTDEALRARIDKFYGAFIEGKFKDAYLLVADDSQDQFFALPKKQYKVCQVIRINYSENFTKAAAVVSCKADWRFHGTVAVTTLPLSSDWEVIDGQWYWHYVKPAMIQSPFSPTGLVPAPPVSPTGPAPRLPDIASAAKDILARVAIDKPSVRLRSFETSQDVVHVRNDMPGQVSLKLDAPEMAGLKVTVGKTDLKAHEETTILFDWRLDDSRIHCLDCAKKTSVHAMARLHVLPTGQVFPITVIFDNLPQSLATPQNVTPQSAPQK